MGKKIFIAVLVVLAAGAAVYYIKGRTGCCGGAEMAVTVVARQDIPAGTVLSEDMLETRTLPRTYMQQDSLEVRYMADIKLLNGQTALVDIPKGNQVGTSSLRAPAGKPAAVPEAPAQQHYLSGIKYLQNANYEKARAEFAEALKLDPKHSEAAAGLERVRKITAGGK